MSTITARVILTSYNMGDAVESDYDAWISYVCEHIDEACGFEVEVDADRFGTAGDDRISGSDEEIVAIREAMVGLWDSWCQAGLPLEAR